MFSLTGAVPAFLLILSLAASAQAARDPDPAPAGPRTVIVLDPVDVGLMAARPHAAGYLREGLARNGAWTVVPADSLTRRMREADLDPAKPCKEFQCAFDAGSALLVDYVLFGTLASLRELQAYTLTLLHVPSAQVVWSRAGEIPRRDGEKAAQALETALGWAVESLDPAEFDHRKIPSLGLMAVVDAGDETAHARVVKERAMAHVYASRNYDLIAQEELEDLLRALDIPAPAAGTPESEILEIGRRMDVRYVLTSRLTQSRGRYRLQLSLHDLSAGKAVREWPSREVPDFQKLLKVEDRFFSTLSDPDLPAGPAIPRPSPVRVAGRYASIAVALAAGAGLGYLAYASKREADDEFRRFQSIQNETDAAAARQKVLEEDVQAKRYGMLSGVCLLLGAAVWTF